MLAKKVDLYPDHLKGFLVNWIPDELILELEQKREEKNGNLVFLRPKSEEIQEGKSR